jgi:hypothetical protein
MTTRRRRRREARGVRREKTIHHTRSSLPRRFLVNRPASGWGGLLEGLKEARRELPRRSPGRGGLINLQRLQRGGPIAATRRWRRTVSGSLMKRTVKLV